MKDGLTFSAISDTVEFDLVGGTYGFTIDGTPDNVPNTGYFIFLQALCPDGVTWVNAAPGLAAELFASGQPSGGVTGSFSLVTVSPGHYRLFFSIQAGFGASPSVDISVVKVP